MDIDQSPLTPTSYLQQQLSQSSPEYKDFWEKISKAHEKKLWHNVTLLLQDFVNRPDTGHYLIDLFEHFIQPIESKLNPLKLVEIARKVSAQYPDPQQTLTFLNSLHSRLPNPSASPDQDQAPSATTSRTRPSAISKPPTPPAAQAYSLSLTSLAYAYLLCGDLVEAKKKLDESEKVLDTLDEGLSAEEGVMAVVRGGYWSVSADYWKVKADYPKFYKSSLLFLACISDVNKDLSQEERVQRAHDLAIAALLGDSIYNFGELLQHPLLASLDGTQYEWLKQILFVFNAGDIGKYETLVHRLPEEPILAADAEFLRQKICLMALIESIFKRPRSQRSLTFQTIAAETRLPVNEVEHLVMKALSLNLIKGKLDQVNSIANIHWVQPRVLDNDQMTGLSQRLEEWCDKVGNVGDLVGSYRQPFAIAA